MGAVVDHAELSPSGSSRWVPCPASVVEEKGKPNPSTVYNTSGTATHELVALCLRENKSPLAFKGRIFEIDGFSHVVDDDRIERAMFYINTVLQIVEETGGELLIEQQLPLENITFEIGATGTGDVLIIAGDWLIVIDLKDGQEPVEAEHNTQLGMYGLGAIDACSLVYAPFRFVRMIIVQPRHHAVREWVQTPEELEVMRSTLQVAARRVEDAKQPGINLAEFYGPGEHACRFCKAKATCPALRATVSTVVFSEITADDFDDVTEGNDIYSRVADAVRNDTATKAIEAITPRDAVTPSRAEARIIERLLPHLPLIKTWMDAVQLRGDELILSGIPIRGYKVVTGKQGDRKWVDTEKAEAALKGMRLKKEQMYDQKLISPTTAEKVLKSTPKRWKAMQEHITRAAGKPTVVPDTDDRPAIQVKPTADHFDDLTVPGADLA